MASLLRQHAACFSLQPVGGRGPVRLQARGVMHSPIKSERRICVRASAAPDQQSEEERVSKVRIEVTKRIQLLGSQGKPKEAIKELANLANFGVEPDLMAATALVRACTRNMELAQNVFDELFGDLLAPDEVSFSVLLNGYGAKQPPDWPNIDATLSNMRRNFGIEPTATSFNCLLEVCARTNDLARGEDIIDRMAADGVEPDEFTGDVLAKRRSLRSYLRKTVG